MASKSGKRGFAAMDQGRRKAAARKGGRSSHGPRVGREEPAAEELREDPRAETADEMTGSGDEGEETAATSERQASEEGVEAGTAPDQPVESSGSGRGKRGTSIERSRAAPKRRTSSSKRSP